MAYLPTINDVYFLTIYTDELSTVMLLSSPPNPIRQLLIRSASDLRQLFKD